VRAAVFDAPGRPLVITERPDPTPGPGELVLRVRSAGVCGTDLHLSSDPPAIPPGTVMGHEFAGDVIAVGADVRGWRPGDRACAMPWIGCGVCPACTADDQLGCARLRTLGQGDLPGAHAELVRVGAHEALRLPNGLDHDAGALVEPLAVAVHALGAAALRPGDDVLVLGAGPIGLAVATCARHFGAADVVVVDRLPARRALAATFGASAAVDPDDDAGLARLATARGDAPAVVVECVGAPGMLGASLQHVRRRGRVVVAGACMAPDTLMPAMACLKEATLHFVMAYSRADFALALRLLAEGRIAGPAMVTDRVGLDAFPAAFEALRRPTTQCKTILRP